MRLVRVIGGQIHPSKSALTRIYRHARGIFRLPSPTAKGVRALCRLTLPSHNNITLVDFSTVVVMNASNPSTSSLPTRWPVEDEL